MEIQDQSQCVNTRNHFCKFKIQAAFKLLVAVFMILCEISILMMWSHWPTRSHSPRSITAPIRLQLMSIIFSVLADEWMQDHFLQSHAAYRSRSLCRFRPVNKPLLLYSLVKTELSSEIGQWTFIRDGLGQKTQTQFLSFTEIGSRDPSPSLCNVNMFCIIQCSHLVRNPNLSLYPSPSPAM